MVTNTAGTTTDLPASKENGDCKKNDDLNEKNVKQTAKESVNSNKVEAIQKNDSTSAMSVNLQEKLQTSNVNAMASSSNNFSNRSFANGLPAQPATEMNGPHQHSVVSYPNYTVQNHGSQVYSGKSCPPRPLQGNQNYQSSMHTRYPLNQQAVSTPTLNQLLTTPSRPSQFSSFGNQSNQQSQLDYGQHSHQQSWSSKPSHDRASTDQVKPDHGNYPSHQQYPASQHSSYPSHYNRYPTSGASQPPYGQQFNSSGMPQAGYPPSGAGQPRHPGYPSFSGYNNAQPTAYYSQRPMQPQSGDYQPPTNSHIRSSAEPQTHHVQQHHQEQANLSGSDKIYQQSKDNIMSPTQVPSPMNPVSHTHPGHPSLAHFRGPSSTPGSPGVASQHKSTPLSPSVRSDSSQPQPPMRPASGHSEHSNPPVPSPISGIPNYGSYRSHGTQQPYGWQSHNYPQHMISTQQPPSNSNSQTRPLSHAQGPPHMRPPSVGKPVYSASQASSHAQSSPAYPQSGGQLPYYDNMAQAPPVMQGYTSASPAPTERRPSRQGSHPPVVHTPEPNSRQGAAAAAAAAMAAAAHSAQPGSASNQNSQTPSYYPQPQQQRMPHPNFNNPPQQGMEVNQQSYPRMTNPGASSSAPQRAMAPPGMGPNPIQGNYHMPPPSHPSQFPTSYGQPHGSFQTSSYPGYFPSNDPNHTRAPRPGYHPVPGFQQQPHAQEEAVKKPAARSASQRLAALFEPANEPGRRQFIDDVLRYWEEKEVPLKNAPLMGRKTLDLFRLYQVVKEKGGMVEVTSAKKWPEISTMLGLGTTSTSGFTLKKQYCKYLYGYECKVGRGIAEPPEALSRITEANRRRNPGGKSQTQENSKDDQRPATIPQGPPPMHSQLSNAPHYINNSPYPSTNQYPPPGQPYQMPPPPSHLGSSYPMARNSTPLPHPGYQQHSGHGNAAAPPINNYPNAPQGTTMPSWSQAGPGQATQIPSGTESVPLSRKNDPPPVPEKEQTLQLQLDTSAPPSNDPGQSIKPPAPAAGPVAASNPFNESSSAPRPPNPPFHPNQTPQMDAAPTFPRPAQESLRSDRPNMPPASYPYNNSSMPRPSPIRGSSVPPEMHSSSSPAPRPSYQPAPSRPVHPSSANTSYPGLKLKRASTDSYAPPPKFMRPDGPQNFPPNHPSFRPDMIRHRYLTPDSPSGGIYRPPAPGLGGALSSSQSRMSPYGLQRFPGYPTNRLNRVFAYGRSASVKVRQNHSPLAANTISKYPSDHRPNLKRHLPVPRSQPKKEQSLFPPDSVEATLLKIRKFRPKTCQSVGLVESWPLIMALKSGLLVESTWALNALNILLFDQRSFSQFRLTQLPGLLDSVVEHFRRCLSKIFFLPSEREALGVPAFNPLRRKDAKDEVALSEEQCAVNRAKQWRKKRKVSKFKGRHAPYKVKVESRCDALLLDNTSLWDDSDQVDLSDDLSHIILTVSEPKLYANKSRGLNGEGQKADLIPCVEATLEDVLSIPCAVLSPEDYSVATPVGTNDENKEETTRNEAEVDDVSKPNENNEMSKTQNSTGIEVSTNAKSPDPKPSDSETKCDNESIKSPMYTSGDPNENSAISESEGSKVSDSKSVSLCNGLQANFALHGDQKIEKPIQNDNESRMATDDTLLLKTPDGSNSTNKDIQKDAEQNSSNRSSIIDKVKQIMHERNVVLLEDEAAGSDGRFDSLSGPIFSSRFLPDRIELSNRLLAISNVIRSFSFIHANIDELLKHRTLMRALAGILLLRHKHKLRNRRDLVNVPFETNESNKEKKEDPKTDDACDLEIKNSKCRTKACKSPAVKVNCVGVKRRKSKTSRRKSTSSELFAAEEEEKDCVVDKKTNEVETAEARSSCLFSSTVLDTNDSEDVYEDPWWWDCVRRIREDALVVLANTSAALDLSLLPDDKVPLAILEACLHWVVCPSSDACDAFSGKLSREPLSAQRLSLEILSKLSIKDQNVDLILALRPFSKVEKLFLFLVSTIGDQSDQILREFSIVLISNLSRGDPSAGRSIALQSGSISNLIAFLEECEERGHNHRQMYRQPEANCGTTVFMMLKAATTLHSLAVISENKSIFMKHQLRLLSLSMSHVLSSRVTSVISSLLFELSAETRDDASAS